MSDKLHPIVPTGRTLLDEEQQRLTPKSDFLRRLEYAQKEHAEQQRREDERLAAEKAERTRLRRIAYANRRNKANAAAVQAAREAGEPLDPKIALLRQ